MFKYTLITTEEALEAHLKKLSNTVCFDTELTGLLKDDLLLGASFYDGVQEPFFVPTDYFFSQGLSLQVMRKCFAKYLPSKKGVAHNAKFDLEVFHWKKLAAPVLLADTLSMAHIYDADADKKLEKLVKSELKISKKSFEEIVGVKWPKIVWKDELLPLLAEYACEDVYYTYKLYDLYKGRLIEDDLMKVHDQIELPIIDVLKNMHIRGVRINLKVLSDIEVKINKQIEQLTKDVYKESGAAFNLNSPKQKAEILFDKLRYPVLKTTPTGGRSTDSEVLEELALRGYPIAISLMEYSTLQKLNSGYAQAIPRFVDNTNILRCNFNSNGTRTGRFSSDNPNLQNQPNNKNFPIRKAFIPRDGYGFQCLDYSQIELRVMGHVSKDKRFHQAFWEGEDIHARVARDLGIERKDAKIVNFGTIYGMGPPKLALMLGISEREAQSIISGYEYTYSGYYKWKTHIEEFTMKHGYVRNIFGRIRRLPEANSKNFGLRMSAMRKAVNTVVQGSAADIIKRAMIQLQHEYQVQKYDSHQLLQVHDELLIETALPQIVDCFDLTKNVMENTSKLSVPLEVDGKIIEDWSQMKNDNFISLYETIKNEVPIWAIL